MNANARGAPSSVANGRIKSHKLVPEVLQKMKTAPRSHKTEVTNNVISAPRNLCSTHALKLAFANTGEQPRMAIASAEVLSMCAVQCRPAGAL
mmetsp:Transcript_80875/g.224720  ORF Transcript_80875/g.224720 Transcript_80875/m.224720 type:complete len:93 (-) Transcript_80875:193-471(-)